MQHYFLQSLRSVYFILGNTHRDAPLSTLQLFLHVLYISAEKRITAWEADFMQRSASAHNLKHIHTPSLRHPSPMSPSLSSHRNRSLAQKHWENNWW